MPCRDVDFLLNALYPGKKIIIWAHNSHVRHDRMGMPGGIGNSMGEWIAEGHRRDLYTIGLFMYRGKAAWNDRQIYDITPVISGPAAVRTPNPWVRASPAGRRARTRESA